MFKFINEILDVPKLIIRLWISLWLILFVLVLIKLLFNIWYPISVENEFIISVCNYLDSNKWLNLIIRCSLYEFNFLLIFQISRKGKPINPYWFSWLAVIAGISFVFKSSNNIAFIGTAIELIIGIVIPILINIKTKLFSKNLWNILYPIIINVVITLWQANILFIRDINNWLKDMPLLITIILQIDYYVFLIITLIGVKYYMSNVGFWLFCKDITKLKAERAKELAKENPNMEKIAEIDKAIAKLESEVK